MTPATTAATDTPTLFKCPGCQRHRPASRFAAQRGRRRGLARYCLDCEAGRNKSAYHKAFDRARAKPRGLSLA